MSPVRATPLLTAGAVAALAGLVLLVVQTSRVLGGNALGGVASSLLWVGVGLIVAGGIALVLAVASDRSDVRSSDGGEPADG